MGARDVILARQSAAGRTERDPMLQLIRFTCATAPTGTVSEKDEREPTLARHRTPVIPARDANTSVFLATR